MLLDAVQDFAVRLSALQPADDDAEGARADAIHVLVALADRATWTPAGWPAEDSAAAADSLAKAIAATRGLSQQPAQSEQELDELPRAFSEVGVWTEVFLRAKCSWETEVDEDHDVEMWQALRLPVLRRYAYIKQAPPSLAYRLTAKAEEHNGPRDWHLHPLEKGKRNSHLGYRLFFDPRRGQQALAWESHGTGPRTWGDPENEVLQTTRSRALHRACLAGVRDERRLAGKGENFASWAGKFGSPNTKKAFVAHPPVASVTPW